MSLAVDGRHIICDAENCKASAHVPVALHSCLERANEPVPSAVGWLCISSHKHHGQDQQHFCPTCAVLHLRLLL